MEDNGGKWRNINEYGFIDINYLSNHAGAYTHFSGGGGASVRAKFFVPPTLPYKYYYSTLSLLHVPY